MVLVWALSARLRDRYMPPDPFFPKCASPASGHVEAVSLQRLQWQHGALSMAVGEPAAAASGIPRHAESGRGLCALSLAFAQHHAPNGGTAEDTTHALMRATCETCVDEPGATNS